MFVSSTKGTIVNTVFFSTIYVSIIKKETDRIYLLEINVNISRDVLDNVLNL